MINSIAICGHGRHGKDTVARIFAHYTRLRYVNSTSWFVAGKMWLSLASSLVEYLRLSKFSEEFRGGTPESFKAAFPSVTDWFNARSKYRQYWADYIDRYNKPTGTKLYEDCLQQQDILTGIRYPHEFKACVDAGLFTISIWVKQPDGPADPTQLVREEDCDFTIINEKDDARGTERKVRNLIRFFGLAKINGEMTDKELYGD